MRKFVRLRQSSENRVLETLVLVGLFCLALFSIGCAGVVSSKPNSPGGGPSVSVTSPANGATVSGVVTITASATDSVGIASVQFLLDGANLGSKVTTSPYSVSWNTAQTSNGSHALAAQAVNTAGKTAASSNVNVTVSSAATPSVSVTSPANGATVSGVVTVTASATDSVGIASVQFLVDGANLGSKVTTSPYSISWNTAQTSNGSHTLAAQAVNTAGKTATSSNVNVTVGSIVPPPPPPAGDAITISDSAGIAQTNRPVSIARAFVQGEIANFAEASINGVKLLTQCDVKNRWPDGSLKFAIVSFIVASLPVNGSVTVSFSNQTSGNNTGFLAKSDMLGSAYNFDGQIQLSGTASHNISARAILNTATTCVSAGSDPDGTIATSGNLCTYWLQGPIVTAVILEDRNGRSFDVNTDSNTGNPLHPRFEAWFYPLTSQVQLGYTLENTWGSTIATKSARDETYSVVLTGGNAGPVTEFTNGAFTMITRSMWHKTFCINGANAGSPNDCNGTTLHIDHNWPYWAGTKILPHWDPNLKIAPAKIASEYKNLFIAGQPGPAGLDLGGCTSCEPGPDGGIGYYPFKLGATGAAEYHGPLPTWDIIYLMSQCDAGNSTSANCGNGSPGDMRSVMLTNADLGGRVPYFYREADMNAGFGGTFDNSGTVGNVQTLGRVISINARTRITLRDATNQNFCGSGHSTDWINFGGSGQDVGGWGTGNLDMSHWPEIATASYLFTGQYHYYEEEMMQGAYSLGGSPGTTSCIANPDPAGNHRQESKGYWPIDQERANDWAARTNLLAASNAVDGSPEKAYFTDKLLRNIAVWEGIHNVAFDMTGPAYLFTDWTYGNTQRGVNNSNAMAGPRGIWAWGIVPGYQDHTLGDFPLCGVTGPTACTQPGFANARFQSAYSGFVAGWIDDLGYCPHPSGNPCGFLTYIAPFYLNQALNPEADIHQFDDYTFPVGGGTPDTTTTPLTSWTWIGNLANYYQVCGSSQANPNYPCTAGQPIRTNVWKTNAIGGGGQCSGTLDENWPAESMAVMSFLYPLTDAQSGYKGSDAYNALRLSYGVNNGCISGPVSFATSSPKWDVTPR